MSDESVLTKPPNPAEIRAELEAMVVGDLLGPAGGESEELTERTVRDRCIVEFHETKQGLRFTISEPDRREVLQRLLKLNHERYAEKVKQGLDEKKGHTAEIRRTLESAVIDEG